MFAGGSFGTKPNSVQWMNSPFSIEKGRCYRLSADVKSTKPVDILPSLMMAGSPWSSYGDVAYGAIHGEPQGTRQSVVFRSRVDAKDARVTFYMGGLPEDTTVEISNIAVDEVAIDAFDFGPDVGNIILDGKKAAFKRWTRDDLKAQDDFWFDRKEGRVFFYSKENPAKTYRSLEAAVMLHVIDHSSVHDAVFDGLDLRYGAAHGFGGASSKRLIIRNCDICWIGGGDQYRGGGEGRRVRYGNGIEFWADAEDNLVENCRLWEVYDAAITNQGSGTNVEKNIVYRDNLIWNCEYSFEYWNRDETSKTENVSFVDNVCLNAGYGWGHVQRPDPNGRCLMFYSNTAQTKNFLVKGNVFANATESLVRSDVAWTPEQPVLDGNVYSQENQALPYVLWRKEKIFRDYMIKSGRVKVFAQNKYMRELGEGSCFGEVALLLDEPRTATIVASCDCKIGYLTKEAFTSLVDENMLNYLHDKIYLQEGYNLTLDDLYYAKGLGQGKFGKVSLVHNKKHFFAIKAVNRKAAEKQKILIKYFIQERNILLTLEHPFIMKLLKTFKTENNIFFLLEYIKGRGLNKYLNSRSQIKLLNEKETIFYTANILLVLDYLNSRQVCHRDLKPDNIIIDEKGYLKIIDFGTSIIIDKNYTNTITGTPHYIAPEILLGQGYGFSCDYWSLGIIAYETYYGIYPFGRNAKDPIDVYKEVVKKEVIYNGGVNSIIQLIGGLLTKNETHRICSLEKAKQYEALKNFEWEDLKEFKITPQYIPKKLILKNYEEYNVKYLQYLRQEESKNQDSDDLLSSYDEKALSFKCDDNWADIF
ncbi:MAG: protein kinase [Thermoguttaceae bacterium]|nr:protein kinase [Thermoguttaceae bacterium]